jgi:predicted Rossmann fold flavoprotein
MTKIAIIGGGAAGFFAALACAKKYPTYQIVIIEKTSKILSKVKVSGGGRCNVTHACNEISKLVKSYPRGEKFLKKAFHHFAVPDTIAWFLEKGIVLKTEPDGRIFPITDDSQTIIDCFLQEVQKYYIQIRTSTEVQKIDVVYASEEDKKNGQSNSFQLHTKNATKNSVEIFDKVIIATGGSPKIENLQWLADIGLQILKPVPSLFTFNLPKNPLTSLMGVAVPAVRVRIADSKLSEEGAILITHWGLSAYSVLKLSAWGARILAEKNYQFSALVSWLPTYHDEQLRQELYTLKQEFATRQIGNKNPFALPSRLWEFLLQKLAIPAEKRWADITKQELHQLNTILLHDLYEVHGKTIFKEEFVTCGGVDLAEIDYNTMQSKKIQGLYFAGEVLDIDGLTGGFNFQAAWTTGYIAGQLG